MVNYCACILDDSLKFCFEKSTHNKNRDCVDKRCDYHSYVSTPTNISKNKEIFFQIRELPDYNDTIIKFNKCNRCKIYVNFYSFFLLQQDISLWDEISVVIKSFKNHKKGCFDLRSIMIKKRVTDSLIKHIKSSDLIKLILSMVE